MNSEREPGGEIRKLTWGIIPNQPYRTIQAGKNATKIGSRAKQYLVSEILEDKNTFAEYGYFEWLIFVSADGKKDNQHLYSRFHLKPDQIEYFLPDGEHGEELFV